MEIFKALFLSAMPLFILSFLLVFWAIKKNYISVDDNEANLKHLKKRSKTESAANAINPIHKKWLFFGGGFYGLMAFVTYFHVEFLEIYNFIAGYTTFSNLLDQLTIGALIGLVIDSFLNLIPAFTWFLYWPDEIDMQNAWYWLLGAYLGYQLGTKCAQIWVHKYGFKLPKENR